MDEYIIVYDKNSGLIIDVLQSDQDIDVYFRNYPSDFINNIEYLIFEDELPYSMEGYIVRDCKLDRLSSSEHKELLMYKRLLTNDERLLEDLKPTKGEIEKAEQTIEILSLIQEVI